MRSLADSEGFILAYPQGSCLGGSSHSNPSLPPPENKSTGDDLGFIEALIKEISSKYNINSERIYAASYSNGAMMTYGLACYKSELIAGIGSVSGTMLDTDCVPSHPISVIKIHGTSDNVLAYKGNADVNSVETVLNFWNRFNNTNAPVVNTDDETGKKTEHYDYAGGTSIEHYKVIGGSHIWDMEYDGANTGELVWNFVSKYDLNGLR
jgi:polyhydroxybutyrate depolymerase